MPKSEITCTNRNLTTGLIAGAISDNYGSALGSRFNDQCAAGTSARILGIILKKYKTAGMTPTAYITVE